MPFVACVVDVFQKHGANGFAIGYAVLQGW